MKLIFSLIIINHLFTVVNKLSLNTEKTKYSFFHKASKKDDIRLCLPKLIISNYEIQGEESNMEHLAWKEHMKIKL